MNKEQIFDEVYRKYADSHFTPPSNPKGRLLSDQLFSVIPMEHSKETFINECKKNNKFSKKWGLKIEERELDMMERWVIADLTPNMAEFDFANYMCDKHNVPTKLITITYNDKTIESYE